MPFPCPHCRVMIDIVEPALGSDVQCPKCGSRISSEMAGTILTPRPSGAGWQPAEPPQESPAGQVENLPHATPPKEFFGRFQLFERLGGGSFGEVFRAYDPSLDRVVALKRPHRRAPPRNDKEANRLAEEARRFKIEAQAAAQLRHPHIVGVYEVGEVEGRPYFTAEYIRGIDLAKLIAGEKESGRLLPARQVAQLCGQVAEALHAAHQAGVVHRDLKPANILVGEDGLPRVMDFGMAKRESAAEFVVTQAGTVLGSPAYMSPEQWQDSSSVGPATDLWSLGVMLFELLTGEFPFRASHDFVRLKEQILNDDPPPPSKLNSQVPADLDTLCLKCLEKKPSDRFPTAAALADELQRFLQGKPIKSRPHPRWELAWKWCQRNPVVASLSAAVVLVLLTGTAVSSFFAFQSAKDSKRANAKADEARLNLYDVHMNLIQRNWEAAQVGLILDLLDKTKPRPSEKDLRGFEWYYWDQLCHANLLELNGHSGQVGSVAFSPDGTRLASASDEAVKIWDTTRGQELLSLSWQSIGGLGCLTFSADGMRLAVAGFVPNKVRVWNVTNGEELLTLEGKSLGHQFRKRSIAFSPDGGQLVSAPDDETVIVWDATNGRELLTLNDSFVTSIAFSPDGKRLVTASEDGSLKLWDVTSGEEKLRLSGDIGLESVAFSPDGQRLASAGSNSIWVWDATSGRKLLTFGDHGTTTAIRCVAFSPDGKRLASAGDDHKVKVWDATSGHELHTIQGHSGHVTSVAFSPDGRRLVSASLDGTVKVWDSTVCQETFRRFNRASEFFNDLKSTGYFNKITCVTLSPDEKQIALGLQGQHQRPRFLNEDGKATSWSLAKANMPGHITVLDSTNDRELRTHKAHNHGVTSLTFSPDGKRLASGSDDKTVKIWDTESGREILTLAGHHWRIKSVAFSPTENWLASASGLTVTVWDAKSGEEVRSRSSHNDDVNSVAFSPDGKRLASGSDDHTIKLWEIMSSQESLTLKGHAGEVNSVAFSPDGQRLASASEDQTVRVWDLTNGQQILAFEGHTDGVNSVTFSRDGRRLVSTSGDQTVRVWDATNGQELLTLPGHSGEVCGVAFSSDGRWLASVSNEIDFGGERVHVWDTRTGEALSQEQIAVNVVRFLDEFPLSEQSKTEWLQVDETLTDEVRKLALEFVQRFRRARTADEYAISSRRLVRQRYVNLFMKRIALLQAQDALRLTADDVSLNCLLAVAQWRAGQIDESLATVALIRKVVRKTDQNTHANVNRIRVLLLLTPWHANMIAVALDQFVPRIIRVTQVVRILDSLRSELDPDEWQSNPDAVNWLQQVKDSLSIEYSQ